MAPLGQSSQQKRDSHVRHHAHTDDMANGNSEQRAIRLTRVVQNVENAMFGAQRKSIRQSRKSHHHFAHHDHNSFIDDGEEEWSMPRETVSRVLESTTYKLLVAMTIVTNMFVVVVDTDHRASGHDQTMTVIILSQLFLAIYVADVSLGIYVHRSSFWASPMNIFDSLICLLDVVLIFVERVVGNVPSVSVLRGLRMFRIVRVLRSFMIFRELYLMMQGLLSAMRSIIFATILLGLLLTGWGIIAVELLKDKLHDLEARGVFENCSRCARSFDSVTSGMLTFISTVVAGDSWGDVHIPLLEEYPIAAFVLIPAFLSVQLGLLNVIAAVIVDRQSQARLEDENLLHTIRQEELDASYQRLASLFTSMDEDGGGCLTLEELMESFDKHREFREIIDLMDISKEELEEVFTILDKDRSGDISYEEFVEQLDNMKNSNTHTMLVFIKHYTETIREINLEQQTVMNGMYKAITGEDASTLATTSPRSVSTRSAEVLRGYSRAHSTKSFEPAEQPMKLTVVSARGLRCADWGLGKGKSDPYCVVEVKGKSYHGHQFKTPVIQNTCTPVWHHEIDLQEYVLGDSLVFSIFDEDIGKKPDFLGRVTLTVGQFFPDGLDKEVMLSGAGVNIKAYLRVRVEVLEAPKAHRDEEEDDHDPTLRLSASSMEVESTEPMTIKQLQTQALPVLRKTLSAGETARASQQPEAHNTKMGSKARQSRGEAGLEKTSGVDRAMWLAVSSELEELRLKVERDLETAATSIANRVCGLGTAVLQEGCREVPESTTQLLDKVDVQPQQRQPDTRRRHPGSLAALTAQQPNLPSQPEDTSSGASDVEEA